MEKGQMRFDINVSVSKDPKQLGTRTEIKNLNSFRSLEHAINAEIKRQIKTLESGEKILQQTRGWDEQKNITTLLRSKENAHEYRYFPEPDIPPLQLDQKWIDKIKNSLPELPAGKRKRYKKEFLVNTEEANILLENPVLGNFLENTMSELMLWANNKEHINWDASQDKLKKITSNWTINRLAKLTEDEKTPPFSKGAGGISPENMAEFATIIFEGKINSTQAQEILEEMTKTGGDPSNIIQDKGFKQISDKSELHAVIDKILAENQEALAKYKAGRTNLKQFFVGQIMKQTKGSANPKLVQELLDQRLK